MTADEETADQQPQDDPEPPRHFVEMVAPTPRAEAAQAMALVHALLGAGVSESDIIILVRQADVYEGALKTAARNHELGLTIWDQLPLTTLQPYQYVAGVCEALGADRLRLDSLLGPLASEWVHPKAPNGWPMETRQLRDIRQSFGSGIDTMGYSPARSLEEWRRVIAQQQQPRDRLRRYLDWLYMQPNQPDADTVVTTINNLLKTYREHVLPRDELPDGRLRQTIQYTSAFNRMQDLVPEVEEHYVKWLTEDRIDRSWTAVAELLEELAESEPGGRNHPVAKNIPVMEAADCQFRSHPYAIMLGLVDGQWPRPPASEYPSRLVSAVTGRNDPAAQSLAEPASWTEAGEFDQFAQAIQAASDVLVISRSRQDSENVSHPASRFLDRLSADPTVLSAENRLTPPEPSLPPELRAIVDAVEAENDGPATNGDGDE